MLGRPTTVNVKGCVAVADNASVTLTVKLDVPLVVGVPEIKPFVARVNPGGKTPEMFVQL
jgi:hypothetical protein